MPARRSRPSSRQGKPVVPLSLAVGDSGGRNREMAEVKKNVLPAPVRAALDAADDRKATDILALDLRGLTDATDFFVVASGTSDAHVRGVADAVVTRLERLG